MTRMTGPDCVVMCNLINTYIHTYIHAYMHAYIHAYLIPPWEDQCEWHRMTRMTGPDCAVMCSLINIHTYIHTYILYLCKKDGSLREQQHCLKGEEWENSANPPYIPNLREK